MNIHKLISKTGRYSDSSYIKVKSTYDQILCEYPKSGVTYLSCLLINFYNKNITANYYNINNFVEDRHLRNSRHDHFAIDKLLKLKKSHYEFHKGYSNVVHLFRNPVDTFVSYYNYLNTFSKNEQNDFKNFVRSRRGIDRWNSHTNSYIKAKTSVRYIPISYERLVSNPQQFLYAHSYLLGVQGIREEDFERAISLSSKENMLSLEKKYMSGGKALKEENLFIGAKKFKKDQIDPSTMDLIKKGTEKTYQQVKAIENNFYKNFVIDVMAVN